MSPVLSRPNYFLTVINQLKEHQVEQGSLEQELQELLLDLAQSVRAKQDINSEMVHNINIVFQQYQAVRLKLGIVPRTDNLSAQESSNELKKEKQQQVLLHAEFVDAPDQLKRMYMEAIVSLLEAMETEQLDLQNCIQCDSWFIPYQRAQVTKFCSSKCRNRYNYLHRKI